LVNDVSLSYSILIKDGSLVFYRYDGALEKAKGHPIQRHPRRDGDQRLYLFDGSSGRAVRNGKIFDIAIIFNLLY